MTAAIGSPISREDYNNLRKIVYNILGAGGTNPITNVSDPTFGYGQSISSSEIGPGDQTITEAQWDQLRVDINKAFTHQVGSASTIPDVAGTGNVGASTATRVTFAQVYQTYLAAANDIVANRNLFAGSQKPGTPVVVASGTQTTTTPWSVAVQQLVDVTFSSAVNARAFFNSGGTINFRSSRDGGTTSPQNAAAQNNSWTSFLNNNGTISFGKAQFYALTTGGLADNATPVFFYTAPAPYSNNYYRIRANSNSNTPGTATFISFKIEWIDSTTIPGIATDYIDGTLTSIISETKSNGVLTIPSPASYNIGTLSPSGTAVNLSPSFTLTSNVNSIDEGGTVTFTFVSRNYPSSKSFQLEISGVSDSHLVGSTTGIKTITTTGNDTYASVNYPVTVAADLATNPGLSLIARVTVQSDGYQAGEVKEKSVTINDTSVTPTPTVSISSTTAQAIQNEAIATSSASTVTVTNTGSKVLNISNISINKGASLTDYSADFTAMSGAPTFSATSIATSQSKTFTVKFAGPTVGAQTAVVTVTSDGNDTIGGGPVAGTNKTANIAVTVITATFGITTSPSLAYTTTFASDGVTAGNTVDQTIRITNSTGNATITLGNPAVSISAVGNLTPTITNNPSGLTIAPSAFREFQIKFAGLIVPSTTSPVIAIDCGTAGTKNITATVTGTQSLANVTVATTSVVAIPKVINVESTTTFTINNSGSAALVVSSITITGQNSYSTYTVSPTSFASIPVGTTQTVTVTSKRSRVGADPATITITSNAAAPNNSKTVSFSMTSQSLTPYYIINTDLFNGHPTDANVPTPIKRNGTIESFVTGAEPGAIAYVYHKQASGVVSGVPAGTTPAAAFASKLLPRNTDGNGKLEFWTAGSSTAGWDVGISRLYAWVPVGKNDDGTQIWYDYTFKSSDDHGYVLMETFPNLTLTITPSSPHFPHTVGDIRYSATAWPKITSSVTGGVQNALLGVDPSSVRYDDQPQGPTLYTTATAPTVGADGTATWTPPSPEPGVWTFVVNQTYKGVVYKSNAVTITPTSGPVFGDHSTQPNAVVGMPEPRQSVYNQRVTWAQYSTTLPSDPNSVHKYFRTVSGLQPNGTYSYRIWADDEVWIYSGFNYETQTARNSAYANLNEVVTAGNVIATAEGKLKLIILFKNGDNQQPTFLTNPAWVSVQILSGNTVVWDFKNNGSAAGY
jgi:hypothetical protein